MSTIDRVFCSTELEALFPLCSLTSLPRVCSDHTPILWDSGINITSIPNSYKFEKWWLQQDGFLELFKKNWNAPVKAKSAIDKWQEKVRRFRKFSRVWSRNIEAASRKLKAELLVEFDDLDIKVETVGLTDAENTRLKTIHTQLSKILEKEEIKARQRSRDRDIFLCCS